MTTVFIVEDDPRIGANLLFQVREAGGVPTLFETAESASARLEPVSEHLPDLLLLDVRLPGMSGVDLVRRLVERDRLPPTIITSGEATISETVEALQLGVYDFIEKPFSKERLMRSIRNALENTSLRQRVKRLESELAVETAILGDSLAIAEVRDLIAQAAPSDTRVLIRGESGTGKELVADALHNQSPRRDGPFIKINCAAIPSHLIEDELYGHVKGAFTDARADKQGLFEEAHGGTLFLDEIGAMDYQLQTRLLRVLEDGQVRRLGETHVRDVDVRVVAATNTDLEAAISNRRFREDLYYRLAHLPIEVPPLRDRAGDVRLLFDHFLDRASGRHRARSRRVHEEVYAVLDSYPWPGNVRELQSLCERLVVFGTDPVSVAQLPTRYREPGTADRQGPLQLTASLPVLPLREFKARSEKQYLESVLDRTGWNVSAAARLLGIQRTYLHQKLATLGCRRPRTRLGS